MYTHGNTSEDNEPTKKKTNFNSKPCILLSIKYVDNTINGKNMIFYI